MKVVIKVGTQAILAEDGTINEPMLSTLVDQIAALQQSGECSVVLVSSGAIGAGRIIAKQALHRPYQGVTSDQLLSSLGQHELIYRYARLLQPYRLQAAQLLLTKRDFHTRRYYLNIAQLLAEILRHKTVIPIINENDSVAAEESLFTDNDELAGLIAAQIGADKLIILSSVAGVYDCHPDEPGAKLVKHIDPSKDKWPVASTLKSTVGRGGMVSKLAMARKMSALGITVHIAAMAEPQVIPAIMQGQSPGTTILACKKKSSLKKWMAFSDAKHSGEIVINACLIDLLLAGESAMSILPIGIVSCSGQFKKGDLIEITGTNKEKIGVGVARYDGDTLCGYLGKRNQPPFIHYDRLYVAAENESLTK